MQSRVNSDKLSVSGRQVKMEEFLKYQSVYSSQQEENIAFEFKRTRNTCYLDHAGAALYSEKQMQLILSDLCDNVYANPHSLHLSSKLTEDHVDVIRFRILQHFNTTNEEYSLVFTSGATAALKLVAETFNYDQKTKGSLVYLENNHTSALGTRSYAKHTKELKTEHAFQLLINKSNSETDESNTCNNMFVYPAQCNFSGTKYPLEWIDKVKQGVLNTYVDTKSKNWYILLDAASLLSTDTLDLAIYKPDFVTVSFYKIFGYPTGLGGLLVRKSSEEVLIKNYFGGGTVEMVLSEQKLTIPRKNISERFEDGTLPFLSILALKHGFDTITRLKLTFDTILRHTFALASYTYKSLLSLHHSNGQPVTILYHDTTFESSSHQGSIINFNLRRPTGEYVGYSEVLHMANLHGIHLRTGCHCNPGGCQRFLNLQSNDVIRHFKSGHVCGDQRDLIDGYPTGTVRISFGYMSTKKDADQFLKLIEDCFIAKPVIRKIPLNFDTLRDNYSKRFFNTYCQDINEKSETFKKDLSEERCPEIEATSFESDDTQGILEQIILYPVKSCGAFLVENNWIVTKKGLKFDREWMIVNSAGVCLTQKQNRNMCLIKPIVNLKKNTLKLNYKGNSSIAIDINEATNGAETYLCQSKVCADRVVGWDCGNYISDWLSENLEMSGLRLLRQYEQKDEETRHKLSFANQAQYLLTNSSSVEWLRNQVPREDLNEDINTTILRFRPNLVVKFKKPFLENEIERLTINKVSFNFVGTCTRCQMICIDQTTANISKEPLLTLSKTLKGKMKFGIYLNQNNLNSDCSIHVGSQVTTQKVSDM